MSVVTRCGLFVYFVMKLCSINFLSTESRKHFVSRTKYLKHHLGALFRRKLSKSSFLDRKEISVIFSGLVVVKSGYSRVVTQGAELWVVSCELWVAVLKFRGFHFLPLIRGKGGGDAVLNFHRAERGSCNLWRGRCFYITIVFAGSGTIVDILVDLS
ncbi:hypothetical protein R1flu_021133 [Riccia fluitans]|uniref:Uncharacterized protein n=1 Tax=Riccia fluitans TaxID=41844 RepID=A0ABD1ZNU0_9MARC